MIELEHLLRPEFISLWFGLLALGAILKHSFTNAEFDNNLIPAVLYGVGFLFGGIMWVIEHPDATGWRMVLGFIVTGGICNGGVAAWFANGGWDLAHGLYKHGLKGDEK